MSSTLVRLVSDVGGYDLARYLTAKQPKILMYHRFSKEPEQNTVCERTFESQLKMIKKWFNPTTLADLALQKNNNKSIKKNSVVITIDDGYRDFYEIAFPLLKHYQIPATFFVTTNFVNQKIWLWPDLILWILTNKKLSNSTEFALAGKVFDLTLATSKIWWPIVLHMLNIPNQIRLDGILKLQSLCNLNAPISPPPEFAAVSWDELEEMQNQGIEIGGHTVNHPSLGMLTEEEARFEIDGSFAEIESKLGRRPRTFCYPNGQPSDYSEKIKQIVAQSGFLAAVTAFSDKHNANIPYAWRRFVACENEFQFKKSLFGVAHLGNILKNSKVTSL